MNEYFDKFDQPDYRLILDCIHCGFCLQICPTYRVLGYEPDSPRGRIYLVKAIAEQRIGIVDDVVEHLYRCVLCRGCETACPSGVKFALIMDAVRGQIARKNAFPPLEAITLIGVLPGSYVWFNGDSKLSLPGLVVVSFGFCIFFSMVVVPSSTSSSPISTWVAL